LNSAVQGELFSEVAAMPTGAFRAYLNDGARGPVDVTFTRNRVTMLSVVFRSHDAVEVRLHEGYLNAPNAVRRALRTYLRTRRKAAWREVAAYGRGICTAAAATRRPPRLRTKGRLFDLDTLRKAVNREFFLKRIPCSIGWGRARPGKRRRRRSRSIRFGSWSSATRTIRIHPILDDPRVPVEFIKYIVFHEMLHAVVPQVRRNGRRYDHPPEFKALERSYPELERMQRLAKELLDVLL
jgi:hypothetical protein